MICDGFPKQSICLIYLIYLINSGRGSLATWSNGIRRSTLWWSQKIAIYYQTMLDREVNT
jgi:hypothetical protein